MSQFQEVFVGARMVIGNTPSMAALLGFCFFCVWRTILVRWALWKEAKTVLRASVDKTQLIKDALIGHRYSPLLRIWDYNNVFARASDGAPYQALATIDDVYPDRPDRPS